MDAEVRNRLARRGLDPDRSITEFLQAIRDDFPLEKLLTSIMRGGIQRDYVRAGIPMAMVLTDAERDVLTELRAARRADYRTQDKHPTNPLLDK